MELSRPKSDAIRPAGWAPRSRHNFPAETASFVGRERELTEVTGVLAGAPITEGTARLHVKHILQKAGFSSRTQVAAWAVEQELTASRESP